MWVSSQVVPQIEGEEGKPAAIESSTDKSAEDTDGKKKKKKKKKKKEKKEKKKKGEEVEEEEEGELCYFENLEKI